MQSVVLTRDHVSIPWGFRLKGGIEYNLPLSILKVKNNLIHLQYFQFSNLMFVHKKVNDDCPASNRLECGDVLISIGNFSALDLRHEEALNLIRMFDLQLPLIVKR